MALRRSRPERSQLQDWLEAEFEIGQRQEMAQLLTDAEKRTLVEHAVSRILSASGTLSEAIVKMVRRLCESLGWDPGELWLLDQQAHVLRCIELWSSPNLDAYAFGARHPPAEFFAWHGFARAGVVHSVAAMDSRPRRRWSFSRERLSQPKPACTPRWAFPLARGATFSA